MFLVSGFWFEIDYMTFYLCIEDSTGTMICL